MNVQATRESDLNSGLAIMRQTFAAGRRDCDSTGCPQANPSLQSIGLRRAAKPRCLAGVLLCFIAHCAACSAGRSERVESRPYIFRLEQVRELCVCVRSARHAFSLISVLAWRQDEHADAESMGARKNSLASSPLTLRIEHSVHEHSDSCWNSVFKVGDRNIHTEPTPESRCLRERLRLPVAG